MRKALLPNQPAPRGVQPSRAGLNCAGLGHQHRCGAATRSTQHPELFSPAAARNLHSMPRIEGLIWKDRSSPALGSCDPSRLDSAALVGSLEDAHEQGGCQSVAGLSTVHHPDIGYESGSASSPSAVTMKGPGRGAHGTTSYGQAVAYMDFESVLISGRPCD
jgi:hypothetical protein